MLMMMFAMGFVEGWKQIWTQGTIPKISFFTCRCSCQSILPSQLSAASSLRDEEDKDKGVD